MKQLINKFLKEQGYAKGQIYKICPDVLLNRFLEYKNEEILKSKKIKIKKVLSKLKIEN